jgi:hypothetical protein
MKEATIAFIATLLLLGLGLFIYSKAQTAYEYQELAEIYITIEKKKPEMLREDI